MDDSKLKEVRLLLGVAGYTMREAQKIRAHFDDECALLQVKAKDLESAGLSRRASLRLVKLREEGAHLAEAERCRARLLIHGAAGSWS